MAQEVQIMTNGSAIKMNKGKFTRTFWLFEDGTAKEYTNEGLREITCDFTTLYALLQRNGWKEV